MVLPRRQVHDRRMASALEVRPAVQHRARKRRLIALGVAITLVVISNVMSNRILPEWAYVPWNLSMAFLLLFVAYRGGAGPTAVGLGIRHWHRPVGVGLLLFGGTALLFALGMALPATRNAFIDSRIGDADVWQMLWVVLIQIPLGTVVLEEVAFRGVLPALMGASPAIRWRWMSGAGRVDPVRALAHPAVHRHRQRECCGGRHPRPQRLADHLRGRHLDDHRRHRHVRTGPGRQGHQDHDAAALGDQLARVSSRPGYCCIEPCPTVVRRQRSTDGAAPSVARPVET